MVLNEGFGWGLRLELKLILTRSKQSITPDDELRHLPELGEFEDLNQININTLNWSLKLLAVIYDRVSLR